MKIQSLSKISIAAWFVSSSVLVGCGGPSNGAADNQITPVGIVDTAPLVAASPSSSSTPFPSTTTGGTNAYGYPGCASTDPNRLCIGLKMVSYISTTNKAVVTEGETVTLVNQMNTIWAACNISFQLEIYSAVNPADYGLDFNPNWSSQSTSIRNAFKDTIRMVVIAVGNLSGSIIAVTAMPGSGLYCVLVDQDYAKNPMTVGHELGHYLGLYHISNTTNLMNPYIGSNTSGLNTNQCSTAVGTEGSYWAKMLR